MKPIHLRFRGLHSYRDPQEVDFQALAGSGLFGIFGPTGAGKSSVVDAITLALYGNVERAAYGTQGIINLAENNCEVQFRFELGGQTYLAERVLERVKNEPFNSKTDKCRLVNETVQEVLADKATEMNQSISRLLGMDMERFTQTAVLPQGKFDRFLRLKPGERGNLLEDIFHLTEYGDALHKRATALVKSLDYRLESAERQLELLGDCSPGRLAEAEAALNACRIQLTAATKAQENATAALQAAQLLAAKSDERQQQQARWQQLQAAKPAQDQIRQQLQQAQKAALIKPLLEHVEARYKEQMQTTQLLVEKKQALDAADQAYTQQQAQVQAIQEAALQQLKQAEAAVSAAEAQLQNLQQQAQARQEAWQTAEADLEAVRQANAAALLAAGLVMGEACPVCGGLEHPAPFAAGAADLAAATTAREQARAKWQKAAKDQEDAQKALSKAQEQQLGLALKRANPVEDAALEQAKTAVTAADLALKLLEQEQQKLSQELESLRAQALAEAINQGFATVNAARKALVPAAELANLQQAREQYLADLQSTELRLSELEQELQGFKTADLSECAVKAQAARELWQQLLVAEASQLKELQILQENSLHWQKLQQSRQEQTAERATAQRLANLLKGKSLVRFLARERLRELAAEASYTISRLSGNKYQLQLLEGSQGSDFIIIDHYNGGQKRLVSTLSGGETFLVSLSLALALSRKIEMQGAPLGFFFLDEGFGTLDEEALELVMNILESLPSEQRLVGLISHVAEVKARLPRYLEVVPADDQQGSRLRLAKN